MSVRRSYESWSHAELCLWLRTSGFANLTDKFSELGLVGSDLRSVDEQFLQTKLSIHDARLRENVLAAVAELRAGSGSGKSSGAPSSRTGAGGVAALQRTQTVPNFGVGLSGAGGPFAEEPRSPNNLPAKRQSLPQINTMQAGSQPSMGVGAQHLMADGTMDCCGWIRKQGGSVRSWKRRYLILKRGCLYYYKDDSASSAQGQFSLEGYRVVEANDSKYQWCIKLHHADAKRRVYVISFSSAHERRQWMEKIEAATRAWNNELAAAAASTPSPTGPLPAGGAPPPPVPQRPASTLPSHARQSSTSSQRSTSPCTPHSLRAANSAFIEHDLDDEEDSEEDEGGGSLSAGGHNPRRHARHSPEVAPRRQDAMTSASANSDSAGDYLQLEEGSIHPPQQAAAPISQNGGRPSSVATRAQRYEITDLKLPPASKARSGSKVQPKEEEECDYIYPEIEVTDILPGSVFQEGVDRDSAEGILKATSRTGMYLIRSGSAMPAQKVLSVWTDDRCRHYKIFYDEKLKFSLQRGTHFATLPTLVQHYHSNALPKCDFRLGMPFQGR